MSTNWKNLSSVINRWVILIYSNVYGIKVSQTEKYMDNVELLPNRCRSNRYVINIVILPGKPDKIIKCNRICMQDIQQIFSIGRCNECSSYNPSEAVQTWEPGCGTYCLLLISIIGLNDQTNSLVCTVNTSINKINIK